MRYTYVITHKEFWGLQLGLHLCNMKTTMIYFIQSGEDGPIKIGYTNGIHHRLPVLQVGSPHRIIFLGTMEGGKRQETSLHKKFKKYKIRGEWFFPTKELLLFIEDNVLPSNTEKIEKNNWGKRLKEIRRKRGMDQRELGELCGISHGAISHYECGRRDINLTILGKIITSLAITFSEFFDES